MLPLLISGTPGNDIDVFLAPLVDDLHILFDNGVKTYDAYAQEMFNLHVVVLVVLTAGLKYVLCVVNKHTILGSLN